MMAVFLPELLRLTMYSNPSIYEQSFNDSFVRDAEINTFSANCDPVFDYTSYVLS
jgi:hypothetical protein